VLKYRFSPQQLDCSYRDSDSHSEGVCFESRPGLFVVLLCPTAIFHHITTNHAKADSVLVFFLYFRSQELF